jgi:phospholipid/cholesterol/gamma-HCH transport system substrate-binding protein
MKRSGRVPWSEVRVGVVIIFAFSVLMWAAFQGTGFTVFRKTHPLVTFFDDVAGLATGSPVWLGGIEVGHVSSMRFVDIDGAGKVEVVFEVEDAVWGLVSSESKASVGTVGLMGDKYVTITTRQPGQPPAEEGDTVMSVIAGDLTTAFSGAPDLMGDLATTMQRLNVVLERIDRGEGFLGRMTTDSRSSNAIDSLVASSRQLMTDLNQSQERLVNSIQTASTAFDSLTQGVMHGDGTLSKLVWDTTLYANLSWMTARADNMIARWESRDGTIDKAMTDTTLYIEVRDLVADTRALLDDIMANPRRYFKFSVF